ncbi:MAG: hypothetical protein AAGI22_15185 [Planctomycetota bacterium]
MAESTRTAVMRLSSRDWDRELGGWRVDLLTIRGAELAGLYVGGERVDSKRYTIDTELGAIRWSDDEKPRSVTVHIRIASRIASQQEVDRWRKLSVVLPFVAAIAGSAATYFAAVVTSDGSTVDAAPTETAPPRNVDNDSFCLQFADRQLLQNVVPHILEESPDGIETHEEALASLTWQVKAQDGFAEFLCGDEHLNMQVRFEDGSANFEWNRGDNPLPRILAAMGLNAEGEDLQQLGAELNLFGICWPTSGDYIVRGLDGGLTVVGSE